jgi:hypothetical protein
MGNLDQDRLRTAFVVYGAMNRKDWRTVSTEDVNWESAELARQLIPTLRVNTYNEQEAIDKYGARLVEECRQALSVVLPFSYFSFMPSTVCLISDTKLCGSSTCAMLPQDSIHRFNSSR